MAPIKFEENIKERLEKRTINPSDNAWNKLSNKLDEQEGKSNSKIIWWIGIAASLVGLFLVTTMFLDKDQNEIVLPTLVETPIKDVIKLQEETSVTNVVVEKELSTSNEKIMLPNDSNTSLVKQKVTKKGITKRNESFKPKREVVGSNVIDDDKIQNKNLINSNGTINDGSNQEIVAQIPELDKNKNIVVTDSEIESLLESAQKDIALNKVKKESTKVVNANSLLQDVETDLEQSFRDKMFNTIISSYNTVKTSVVERNY